MVELNPQAKFDFRTVRDLMKVIADDPCFEPPAVHATGGDDALPVEIREIEGSLIVEAPLPGFSREDVEIAIEGGVLSIDAHRSERSAGKGHVLRLVEENRSMARRIVLPEPVTEEDAVADLRNGLLTVLIRLAEPSAQHGRND